MYPKDLILTTSVTDLYVKGSDAVLFASSCCVLRGQHGRVRGRLVAVGFDLHSEGGPAIVSRPLLFFISPSRKQLKKSQPNQGIFSALSAARGNTNVRSVMWTKVSLKEAKMRATANTSSEDQLDGKTY